MMAVLSPLLHLSNNQVATLKFAFARPSLSSLRYLWRRVFSVIPSKVAISFCGRPMPEAFSATARVSLVTVWVTGFSAPQF